MLTLVLVCFVVVIYHVLIKSFAIDLYWWRENYYIYINSGRLSLAVALLSMRTCCYICEWVAASAAAGEIKKCDVNSANAKPKINAFRL